MLNTNTEIDWGCGSILGYALLEVTAVGVVSWEKTGTAEGLEKINIVDSNKSFDEVL